MIKEYNEIKKEVIEDTIKSIYKEIEKKEKEYEDIERKILKIDIDNDFKSIFLRDKDSKKEEVPDEYQEDKFKLKKEIKNLKHKLKGYETLKKHIMHELGYVVSDNIVKVILEKYNNEYTNRLKLNKAERIIIVYFQELKDNIKKLENELNEKISLEIGKENDIINFRIEDEYIIFRRLDECIEVIMSNRLRGHIKIIPDPEIDECIYNGNFIFRYTDVTKMIKKSFKFLNKN
ncbi:hypothetical protein [Clostridium tetani]|uniref:hypothetical protein n=1 Tax=Clostridium tetani TaxID=1513 RepID=UPI000513FD6B|nr:hypothetical protein [Clostridium tetani]KGI43889.1 hypothetical protein KY55_05600 [Clostridium tetani]RXI68187.1 hypothetical protein DP127_12965 [Clostridium tetani]BDR75771.1 hypothetical protein K154306013_14310 [Clostridium tetani]BDR86887.1 hypothetical protein N071400001_14950 [Clostridium tetani]